MVARVGLQLCLANLESKCCEPLSCEFLEIFHPCPTEREEEKKTGFTLNGNTALKLIGSALKGAGSQLTDDALPSTMKWGPLQRRQWPHLASRLRALRSPSAGKTWHSTFSISLANEEQNALLQWVAYSYAGCIKVQLSLYIPFSDSSSGVQAVGQRWLYS